VIENSKMNGPPSRDEGEGPLFFKTSREKARGLVMVVHGLNTKPSKMGGPDQEGTIVKLFLDAGFHTLRVTLRGHGNSLQSMRTVDSSKWLNDGYNQYRIACDEAQKEGLPLYLAAFSMGALVFEYLMTEAREIPVRFARAVLFAPALAVKVPARSVMWLGCLLKDTAIMKSLSPAPYRAHRGASLAAYRALFELEKAMAAAFSGLNNIETLVFMAPRDEVVSIRGIRSIIRRFGLSKWRIHELFPPGTFSRPCHFIIDAGRVGEKNWQEMTRAVLNHFGAS
jgi:alpha-beta hydrolase superfamily lysophospholipase